MNAPLSKRPWGKFASRVKSRWEERPDDHDAGVPVKITLKDGRVLEHTTPMGQIFGSQKNPWSTDAIVSKFRENAGMALPPDKVEQAIKTWSKVDEVKDLGPAIKTLVAVGR